MSREIKFRARRIDNGEWVYGYYFKSPLTNETGKADNFLSGGYQKHQIASEDGVVFEIDIKTLGQYTGFKDRNGKEVYEGDIVKTWYDENLKVKGSIAVIKYLDRSFCMTQQEDDTELDCVWFNIFEVIGNIYQDKHLIK